MIMTRTTTTLLLEDLGCAGGTAHSLETVLTRLPGVLRAYVNPVTESAYVEFDAERCSERELAEAAESLGVHAMPARRL